MKQINSNSPFLQNIFFLMDKYKFSLVSHNLEIDETKIYSDEESYIFVLGKKHKPIWLWTIDNISKEKIFEIKQCIECFGDNGLTSYACKESLYLQLDSMYAELNSEELSGCYVCREPIVPRECEGYLEKAKEEDKDIITQMWYADCVEANPEDHITYELAQKFTERFLDSGTFYVWRDNNGKIVSMIDYTVVDNYAEVAHAYTIPEERGKGYMANSVYELTRMIIKEDLTPVLSTDYHYGPSNKCYQNVGYQLEDKIVVFSNKLSLKKESSKLK
jgi:hypothetical protein